MITNDHGKHSSEGYPDRNGMCWPCNDLVEAALATQETPALQHFSECASLPLPYRVPAACNCAEIERKEKVVL